MTIQPLTEQIKRSRHLIIPHKTIYAMNIAYTPLTSYIDLRILYTMAPMSLFFS
jgi:hypothetical protein